MNFDFSDEQQELRAQARRFFQDRCPTTAVRKVLEGQATYDKALWAGMAEMGFLGVLIPEAYGGLDLTPLELCVIAEEVGRAIAPVPFSSSVYLATGFLLQAGSEAQKARWLPKLASGEAIGAFAFVEGVGAVTPASIKATLSGGKLTGTKVCVADGSIADFAVVAVREGAGVSLCLVELDGAGVARTAVETVDPSRNHANIAFTGAAAEPLGEQGKAWPVIERVFDQAAVFMAFEQVGGSDMAIAMGRDYASERMAFGRPIGSFQAIKHMLANMFVSATLARANAYYGAWALSSEADELPQAAATARVSATRAYQEAALSNMQVHGGMGFTWELDCHLHYRRSNLLSLALGGLGEWEGKLVDRLQAAAA